MNQGPALPVQPDEATSLRVIAPPPTATKMVPSTTVLRAPSCTTSWVGVCRTTFTAYMISSPSPEGRGGRGEDHQPGDRLLHLLARQGAAATPRSRSALGRTLERPGRQDRPRRNCDYRDPSRGSGRDGRSARCRTAGWRARPAVRRPSVADTLGPRVHVRSIYGPSSRRARRRAALVRRTSASVRRSLAGYAVLAASGARRWRGER